MPEDEHRAVGARGQLVEPLQLLVADLARVAALDDRVEHGEVTPGSSRSWQARRRSGDR